MKRDWDMLMGYPPEWDCTNDLKDWMLPPFTDADRAHLKGKERKKSGGVDGVQKERVI